MTTGLTAVLMLLGIWTAVAGYGLTCEARWPFCDGAVYGLFPANFGSFVEWFHRLVAMIVGFGILWTTGASWFAGASRRVRAAFTLALVLTPIQVVLGALTVTTYEQAVLASHFGAALVILTLLVAGTVWLVDRTPRAIRIAAVGAGTIPAAATLTPDFLIAAHSIRLHLLYYALAIVGYVALVALALGPGSGWRRLGLLAGGGAVLVAAAMTVGRVSFAPGARLAVAAGLVTAAVLAVGALSAVRGEGEGVGSQHARTGR